MRLPVRGLYEALSQVQWLANDPGDPGPVVTGVSTDSRRVDPGQLYVALRGERFDGHDFVAQARQRGAAAVLVEHWSPACGEPALVVPDTRRGLGELARVWRSRFRIPLIAVAGSNGKTTVKEMIAAILAAHWGERGYLATRGNLNNDIGLPLTLSELAPGHQAAVVEIGMNQPGEMAWLASVAQANIGLVNNAQREHQEFLGSVEASARENAAVLSALPQAGVAVFPGDDPFASLWRNLAGARRRIEFGLGQGFEVSADPEAQPEGFELRAGGARLEVKLAIAGRHNVRNALAAAACCQAAGVPMAAIGRGLAAFRPVPGRLVRLVGLTGATLIDDSYNANPDSVRAAIEVLAACPVPRLFVLGDMAEVGIEGPAYHAEVGDYARQCGVQALYGFGPLSRLACESFGPGAEHFQDLQGLCKRVAEHLQPGTTVLVKGSRSMAMERVVEALASRSASERGES